jgi:hypothetical protein
MVLVGMIVRHASSTLVIIVADSLGLGVILRTGAIWVLTFTVVAS